MDLSGLFKWQKMTTRIQSIVTQISDAVTSSGCYYPVPTDKTRAFYVANMPHILTGLKDRGFNAVHSLVGVGTDGRLYDIAGASDHVVALVHSVLEQSYIIVSH